MRFRTPSGFGVTAVALLSIGMTAVVTMTAVYEQVVRAPVRTADPGSLLSLTAVNPSVNFVPPTLTWQRFDAIRRQTTTLTDLAAYDTDVVALGRPGLVPQELRALRVSGEFFDAIGLRAWRGRVLVPDEDVPNGPKTCVLAYETWRAVFGGADVVGQTIAIDGASTEVVGILQPGVTPPWGDRQIFLPRAFEDSGLTAKAVNDGAAFLEVIARPRPDATRVAVAADLATIDRGYAKAFAGRTDASNRIVAGTLVDEVVAGRGPIYLLLLAAVIAVWTVACANASALQLGRVVSRRREFAVKQALGARRLDVVWELSKEALGLGAAAAASGLLLAAGALSMLQWMIGSTLPPGVILHLDGMAIAVSMVTAVASAAVVGIWPALDLTRAASRASVTAFGRVPADDARTRRVRGWLVVGEVALSTLLLIAASLMIASLVRLERTSPGFDPDGVAAGFVTMPPTYATSAQQVRFASDVLERVTRVPQVESAAFVFGLPFHDQNSASTYAVYGRPISSPGDRARAGLRIVTPDYFRVMRMHLVAGRGFGESDRNGAPGVCVVNESLARRQFGGPAAIGHVILRGRNADQSFEIVGIVGDVWTNGLRAVVPDEIFYPFAQLPRPTPALVARTRGNPDDLAPVFAAAIADVDPALPLARFASMPRRLAATLGPDRVLAALSTAFALVAVLLAATGLYAVLAHGVSARRVELSVRMAIGASPRAIIGLVVGQAMRLTVVGIAIGLAGAVAATRVLRALLVGMSASDAWIFLVAALVFAAVALAAAGLPAWRASRVSPAAAFAGE